MENPTYLGESACEKYTAGASIGLEEDEIPVCGICGHSRQSHEVSNFVCGGEWPLPTPRVDSVASRDWPPGKELIEADLARDLEREIVQLSDECGCPCAGEEVRHGFGNRASSDKEGRAMNRLSTADRSRVRSPLLRELFSLGNDAVRPRVYILRVFLRFVLWLFFLGALWFTCRSLRLAFPSLRPAAELSVLPGSLRFGLGFHASQQRADVNFTTAMRTFHALRLPNS